jgi:DNA-binding transcriptional MerR regulator
LSEHFHISGLARRSGRSVHTIRWYEAQGLIPRVGRDAGGRRVYEAGHLEHLLFLDRMRRAGMSVAEMRRLTELSLAGWPTLGERMALLKDHRRQVETQIEELKEALDLIDAKLGYYEQWSRQKKRPRQS